MTHGGTAALPGRKSAAAEEAKAQKKKRSRRGGDAAGNAGADAGRGKRAKFGSAAVFGQLQDQREAAAAGVKPAKKKPSGPATTSKALKL